MVMSIEEARRLVNNRRRREAYNAGIEEEAHLEELYELDEMLAVYIAENADYIADTVQVGLEESYGTNQNLPVYIGFDNKHAYGFPMSQIPEDVCEVAQRTEAHDFDLPGPEVMACLFDPAHSGIDADREELAMAFAEVVADMYIEAGWQVSEIEEGYWFWTYPEPISGDGPKTAPKYPRNGKSLNGDDYGPVRSITGFELYF